MGKAEEEDPLDVLRMHVRALRIEAGEDPARLGGELDGVHERQVAACRRVGPGGALGFLAADDHQARFVAVALVITHLMSMLRGRGRRARKRPSSVAVISAVPRSFLYDSHSVAGAFLTRVIWTWLRVSRRILTERAAPTGGTL